MNTVLTVDHQSLSVRILLSSLRVDILVHSGRAHSSKKSSVFFNVRLDVSCSIRFVDVKMNWLIFGMIRTGSRNRGEDVEGENTIGCWVIDRFELTVGRRMTRSASFSSEEI